MPGNKRPDAVKVQFLVSNVSFLASHFSHQARLISDSARATKTWTTQTVYMSGCLTDAALHIKPCLGGTVIRMQLLGTWTKLTTTRGIDRAAPSFDS